MYVHGQVEASKWGGGSFCAVVNQYCCVQDRQKTDRHSVHAMMNLQAVDDVIQMSRVCIWDGSDSRAAGSS